MELAAGIASATFKDGFEDGLKATLKQSIETYSNSDVDKLSWDNVQKRVKLILVFI